MTFESIKSVGIIGAGTMGRGIAQVCALAGLEILLFDVDRKLSHKVFQAIEDDLSAQVKKGKINDAGRTAALNLITFRSDITEIKAPLIIEAVVENLEVKQKLFEELEQVNTAESIFATNTSSIPVTQLAAALQHKDRFAGLHFFNPATAMKLIEVVKGAATSDQTVQCLSDFSRKLGRQPVVVQDSPGFIVNRVARHYYVEALRVLEENVADVKTIDTLMRSSGFRMGPFELMDLIGLDVNLAVTKSVYNGFHQDPKFRPSRIQQQKVDAGELGKKTGKGFYDYK